jgi:hypothetical protein
VNSLGYEAMGLARAESTDKGELAVLGVITESQLMRQQCLPDAV